MLKPALLNSTNEDILRTAILAIRCKDVTFLMSNSELLVTSYIFVVGTAAFILGSDSACSPYVCLPQIAYVSEYF
jgi:hypothetical protein